MRWIAALLGLIAVVVLCVAFVGQHMQVGIISVEVKNDKIYLVRESNFTLRYTTTTPPKTWVLPDYDDSSWNVASAPLIIDARKTYYIRVPFNFNGTYNGWNISMVTKCYLEAWFPCSGAQKVFIDGVEAWSTTYCSSSSYRLSVDVTDIMQYLLEGNRDKHVIAFRIYPGYYSGKFDAKLFCQAVMVKEIPITVTETVTTTKIVTVTETVTETETMNPWEGIKDVLANADPLVLMSIVVLLLTTILLVVVAKRF